MPDPEETTPKNQRTVHVGGNSEDNVIIAGDNVTVNIHKIETPPTPPPKEQEPAKPAVQYKKIALIAAVIIAALIVGVYLKISKTLNISGKWIYHASKDERIWIMTQKGRDITIEEDSGNKCIGHIESNSFSFSCREQMTGGAESEKFTGTGQLNQDSSKIQGKWERQGLEGGFVLERMK